MTRCSRAIKQIDYCNSQAISAFKAGKISEAEIWHDMAERKQAELDGMTLSECRQGVWAGMNEKMKKPLEDSLRLFLTNEELRFFMSFFKKEAQDAVGKSDS